MDFFSRVRNAFVANLRPNLEALGLVIKSGGGANHVAVKCPFCTDTSASASLEIHSGYLKCFQCGHGSPLFDWVQKRENLPTLNEAVDLVAQRLGIEKPKRAGGKPPSALNEAELELAVQALWSETDGKPFRDELERRGFSQRDLLPFFLGLKSNLLVFPRVRPDGGVAPAYHAWRGPWVSGAKWCWQGVKGSPPNYLWPSHITPREGRKLLLCEGEWDVLIARIKLDADAYTWTGGANAPLSYAELPEWAKRREWDIAYDNDVWQGPGVAWAPDDKKRDEMKVRQRNLIEKVGRVLEVLAEGKVRLLTVPVDPKLTWGGDLRDAWTTGRLPSLDAMVATPLSEARPKRIKAYKAISITSTSELAPEMDVELSGRFSAGVDTPIWFPEQTWIHCPMGQLSICSKCRVPEEYGSGVISWEENRELQAQVFASRNPNETIIKHVIGKPFACTKADIKHSPTGRGMMSWSISEDTQSSQQIDIPVFSKEVPSLSQTMTVRGTTFLPKDSSQNVHVIADEVQAVQSSPFNLTSLHPKLLELCPWSADTIDKLETYFAARYNDLASHVTRIFGADMMHLCFELVTHSALRFHYDGALTRGWIDAAMIGVTRSGKSQVARRLIDHESGLPTIRSTQASFSAAGLLAMQQRSSKGLWRSKPGLFPQSHGKALVLDEFHLMFDQSKQLSPMDMLQEVRDQGTLHIQKASSVQYQAAVRLLTIANPLGSGGFESMSQPCEQLFELYGKPEFISRLDYLLTITDLAAEEANRVAPPEEAPHLFTQEVCTGLVRRAWDLQPEDIQIEQRAIHLASETCQAWAEVYSTELPLFTGSDKVRSILRVAIAIANLCYSHPEGQPLVCFVRRCHVQLAVQVMEKLFTLSGYGEYSLRSSDKAQMVNRFDVEWLLVKNIVEPAVAANILRNILGEFNQNDLMSYLNLDMRAVQEWQHKMFSCGALARRRTGDKFLSMRLTKPCNKLVRILSQMAEEDPERFKMRRQELAQWMTMRVGTPAAEPHLDELVLS